MTTFWEIAVHLVSLCSLCNTFIFNFSYIPFRFVGQEFGSECTSSWSVFTFYFDKAIKLIAKALFSYIYICDFN